ncbi:MAG: aminoacyl-histidine dipeptidase [Aquabacterium sp.]|uniref:aminoacyl-histidine dipeptidase n=1 Tax=Aquabacterium sp. TaxID=1872578 RepID=UPI00271F8051|nr:aminoacyl-histidine dipeptidase [Aquabacterium sp.]MDO9002007.1 aminoacyl-histidine dipeptidase [Aquabacterium sp.]
MFSDLHPSTVWAHFATLCRIPRQSKQEEALRDHLREWANGRGLATQVDAAGNLIVRKSASPGREHVPGMVLQGHLDMVCQKNSDSTHDFSRDPIKAVLREGFLVAEDTTLGADNGMGVAMILAVLEDRGLAHGPIEALFTVDEEAGMGGAQGLASGVLQGSVMLNLDTEEWGEFYLGCAGGMDVNVSRPGQALPLPGGHETWQLSLRGLRGGHSGVNIHEERGNAIKLLVRVLHDLARRHPMLLSELRGGTARNALPREAFATIALPAGRGAELADELVRWQNLLSQELAGVEPGLQLSAQATSVAQVLSDQDQGVWLNTLHASPHGVRRMSQRVPSVVETSNNLGMVDLKPSGGNCNFMVRSLLDSGSQALADEIVSLWALSSTVAESAGQYPGWTPNPDSALLKLCQRVYRDEFQAESTVQVIHAGLECGIIAAKYPGMDIVSFGPTIRGAHAPGESVDVASVARTWQLLTAILAAHA